MNKEYSILLSFPSLCSLNAQFLPPEKKAFLMFYNLEIGFYLQMIGHFQKYQDKNDNYNKCY